MSHADNVRDYCISDYVAPARRNGERFVVTMLARRN
jgi:hypothetical protein